MKPLLLLLLSFLLPILYTTSPSLPNPPVTSPSHMLSGLGYGTSDVQRFSDEDKQYILNHRIPRKAIAPFLRHPYFKPSLLSLYQIYQQEHGLPPFEAVNLAHEPLLYPSEGEVKPALEKQTLTVLVNRNYYLNEEEQLGELILVKDLNLVIPGNIERNYLDRRALDDLRRLFDAGLKEGVVLFFSSGYRSYRRQEAIHEGMLLDDPNNFLYSAKPGHSEHQTGLSIDVTARSVDYQLLPSFDQTEEGRFLKAHAHQYGFILRYPKGKEWITGYAYEPWHLRYVGHEAALYIHKHGLTLEEYLLKTVPFPYVA